MLDHDPVISPERRHMQHPVQSDSRETLTSGTEHSDYSYSAAVGRLRDMLHRVTPVEPQPTTPKTVIFAPPQRVRIGCCNFSLRHKCISIFFMKFIGVVDSLLLTLLAFFDDIKGQRHRLWGQPCLYQFLPRFSPPKFGFASQYF